MNKGVSLYLAILVMVVLLSIVLGLSTILLIQIRMVGEMENSVMAFSAADSGIEKVLNEGENATDTPSGLYYFSLDNGASCKPDYIATSSPDCPDDTPNFCINSKGTYRETQRAIQATR